MGQAIRRIQHRKRARATLSQVMSKPEYVTVIHYSCESFYDRADGSSPRITSIAALNADSRQTGSFSIHQIAERQSVPSDQIEQQYDRLERLMLDEFYDYVRSHIRHIWLHWNMRNINYGFQAIAHRYRVLGGQPVDIPEANLVDLSHLLVGLYGVAYMPHPRLTNLIDKNKITRKDFLTGAEEAQAFNDKEYVKLHQSTLRKVDVLVSIAERADIGSLKTFASRKDVYGGYLDAFLEYAQENKYIAFAVTLVGIVSGIIGIVAYFASK